MKDFKGETKEEQRLIVNTQRANGSFDNGWVGIQTFSDLAISTGTGGFPYTLRMYSQPTIIGNDIILSNPQKPLSNFKNSMVGSFTYPRAEKPCSIMINNGKIIFNDACHAWFGCPEAVMYKSKGKVKMGEYKYATELPKDTEWAIGGFGLLNYHNPAKQGFKTHNGVDYYNSVAYRTDHAVLGYRKGKLYGVLFRNKTANEINSMCKNQFAFDLAVMLDGGGLGAMNGEESFAKVRTNVKQGYMVQFI